MSPTTSSPTTASIQVASFNCDGCDCGACASDAADNLAEIDGVVHVRLDRRRRAFVIRYDEGTVDEAHLISVIRSAKLKDLLPRGTTEYR
jgi:copper chaperone CopZ